MSTTTTTTILSPSDTLLGMSGDGNLISFMATSGDTDTLYVLNLQTNQTSTIDSAPVTQGGFPGAPAMTGIDGGMFSGNGQYILYSTGLTDENASNGIATQFFEKDLSSTTPPINVTPNIPVNLNFPGVSLGIEARAISDDGLTIAYSEAFIDFTGTYPNFTGVVVEDLVSGSQQQIPTVFEQDPIELTPDGRYFTYEGAPNFYVVDRQSNTEVEYTAGEAGAVSDDGRYVVYTNVGATGKFQLLVHDNDASPNTPDNYVSESADGVIGNDDSEFVAFSGDGRHVLFESGATNLVPGDTDGVTDLFVKNLDTGGIQLIGPAVADATKVFVSYDGSQIIAQGSGGITITKFAPSTLTVNPVTGDDLVNAAEAPIITVSGTSNAIGSTILVSLPGSPTATGALVHSDGTWSAAISVQGIDDGPTHVHAVIADELGTSVDRPFTIDLTPPTDLAITAVAGDNIINAAELKQATVSGTVLVANPSGTGTDVGKLTISIDGGNGTSTFTTPGSQTAADATFSQAFDASGVSDGMHTVTVTATDPAGNTSTTTKKVLVDTTPPKIAITSVSGDDVVNPTEVKSAQGVHGTSDAIGATVDVLIDGVEAGQAVVQADGTWLTTVSFASAGTGGHDVTANVSDEAGNVGRADAGVYVDRGFSAQQLSIGPAGQQGGGSGVTFPVLDAAGDKLVFTGLNFNLMSTATGSSGAQVYIKDLITGAITFATLDPSENAEFASISADGRYIEFVSNASLDPDDQSPTGIPPGYYLTYTEDLTTNAIYFHTLSDDAYDGTDPDTYDPGITPAYYDLGNYPDGTPIQSLPVFPLAIADGGDALELIDDLEPDQVVQPLVMTTAIRLDVSYLDTDGNRHFYSGGYAGPDAVPPEDNDYGRFVIQEYAPQISADGTVIAFEARFFGELWDTSGNPPAVTIEPPTLSQIYAGPAPPGDEEGNDPIQELASSYADGTPMPFGAVDPALSADGQFVAFWSWGTDDVPEVYVKNLTTGELKIASSDALGNPGVGTASGTFTGGFNTIAISADGRYVAFTSDAVLTPDDSGTGADLFVKDMQTGAIQRLNLPAGTFANDLSTQLAMRADGQYIVFVTSAALSSKDTNKTSDVYGVSLAALGTPPQIGIDPVAGDDRINAGEVSKTLAVTGSSDAIGQTVTLYFEGNALPGVVVGANGTWSTSIDVSDLPDNVYQLRATVGGSSGATNTDGDLITIDTVAPTVTLSADKIDLAPDQTATITASFSEGIGNLASDFLSGTGGTLSDLAFVNDHTLTVLFTPTSGATAYGVEISPESFFDYAGNANISGASLDLSESAAAGPVISGDGQSAVITSGQTSNGVVVESGGTIIVSSGGTALDTIVSSGGTLIVQPGGFADPTVVSSGGTEIVSATGTDLGALVQDGGLQIVHGGVSGVTVSGGGEQYIGADGTSLAVQVQGGGDEVVFGTDSGASLSGTQYNFGTASGGTTESGGYQLVAPGAVAVGMTVAFGGQQYIGMGGTTLAAQVASGGAEVVFGTDSGASLSGTQYLYGTANGGTTFNGGYQLVASGATASGMTVESDGYQYIGSGGTATATQIVSQGAQIVFGSALAALINGTQYDFAYASGGTTYDNGFQLVAPTATAIGMRVLSGGEQYIGAGGTVLATDIGAQGAEVIFGTDSGALISGTQYVFGIASGGTTSDGGYQLVGPAGAGTALGMTVLAGGQQYVVDGGTASGTELMSQGVEIVHGTDLGATISGTQYVYGLASGTVVGTGGYQLVGSGASISAVSISGGTVELQSGGSNGTAPITFTGAGELILDASTTFSGTVAGFGLSDAIDLADIPYVSSGAGATASNWTPGNGSGTLAVSEGGQTANITLLGQYAAGNFNLVSDNHGGTLVLDPPLAAATDPNPLVLTTTQHA